MSAAEIIAVGDGVFKVTGPMVFATAGELLESSRKLFASQTSLRVDLSDVTHVDSAALALLIEWLRRARQQQCSVHIEHVPKKLLSIARLTGVEDIIATPGD